jgi:aryl-alcohol dehydrogenase-like predicted oxidoreductase
LKPSAICLGTGAFGTTIGKDTAWGMMDAFVALGGTFLDTAHVYASWLPGGEGASERTIGEWLAANGSRDRIVIGTKGGTLNLATLQPPAFSPEQVARELGESLTRLRTDYADIYWLHRDNPGMPVSDILGVLAPHVAAGTVRALGVSNWSVPRLREAAACACAHALPELCASQIGWSLARTTGALAGDETTCHMDEATYAYHVETGMPVVAYSSQAQGFFSGKGDRLLADAGQTESRDSHVRSAYGSPENFLRLARAQAMARRYGTSAHRLALAYVLNHPFPTAAIIGPRTVAQLEDSCAAAAVSLSAEDVAHLAGLTCDV